MISPTDADTERVERLLSLIRETPRLLEHLDYLATSDSKWNQLKRAFFSVGLISVGVSIAGITVILLSIFLAPYVSQNAIGLIVLKDIGLGLIVAGISVFGFEWLSHLNTALKKIDGLNAAIKEIVLLGTQIESLEESNLQISAVSDRFEKRFNSLYNVSRSSYEICLTNLFSESDEEVKFRNAIQQIISSAIELKQSGTIMGRNYLLFMVWFLERSARYTSALSAVNQKMDETWSYRPPRGVDVTSEILARQINSLDFGDSYSSITKPSFWLDEGMKEFLKESKGSMKKGVKIRRIFNFGSLGEKAVISLLEKDIKLRVLLGEHMALTARKYEINGVEFTYDYELRLMTKESANQAHEQVGRILGGRDLYSYSFGLFDYISEGGRHEIIRYRVLGDDISEIQLKYCGHDDDHLTVFKVVWESCRPDWPRVYNVVPVDEPNSE